MRRGTICRRKAGSDGVIRFAGLLFFVIMATLATSRAKSANADDAPDAGCGAPVVLIGHVERVTYQGHFDDFNGRWTLDIQVRHLLRGAERRRWIVAHAAADARLRRGDYLLFLGKGAERSYGVLEADNDIARGLRELAACR